MTVEELALEVEKLTVEEKKILASEIELRLARQSTDPEERRRAALRSFLLLGGTAHSDHTDVSSEKLKHLAAGYAANQRDT